MLSMQQDLPDNNVRTSSPSISGPTRRRSRPERAILWILSNWQKTFIYSIAMVLGGIVGASFGLGLLYAVAAALATPLAIKLGNRITNPILNYLFPSSTPRTAADSSSALLMTASLAFSLSFGLSISWMAALFFLSPLVIKSSLNIVGRTIEYLFPAMRTVRTNLQTLRINLLRDTLLVQIRNHNDLSALRMLRNFGFANNVDVLMSALFTAITVNNLEIFNYIVALPQIQSHLARENNSLLVRASYEGRTEMVTALLRNEGVQAAASANNNEALRYACRENHVDTVEALLGVENVREAATYNHLEALRLAQVHNDFRIVALLLQIPAVANYVLPDDESILNITLTEGPPADPDPDALRNLAQGVENSMTPLSKDQLRTLELMRTRYRATLNARGRDAVLRDIRGYFVEEYNRNPAIHNGRRLPMDYSFSLTPDEKTAYHQHKIHAAHRFLFLNPNPWTRSGDGSYLNGSQQEETICYMWLATNDANQAIPENFTRDSLKEQFADTLYQIGRAHNWDGQRLANGRLENYDDNEPDRPSCGAGMMQRLMQFLTLFLNSNAETRPLSAAVIKQKLREDLIAEGPNPNTLLGKLSRLSRPDLEAFEAAFNDWFIDSDGVRADISAQSERLLQTMEFSQADIDAFVEQCKQYFGAQRITNTGQNISYKNKSFDTYELYIREIAKNAIVDFADQINTKIQALKNAQPVQAANDNHATADKSQDKTKDKPQEKANDLTFSEGAKAHTSGKRAHASQRSPSAAQPTATTYHQRPPVTRRAH